MNAGNDSVGSTEAIGYILLFGVIISATAIIYLQGQPAFRNVQEQQTIENADEGILLLKSSVREITEGNAPGREVRLNLQDATVGVEGSEEVWFNVSLGGEVFNHSVDPVYYRKGDQRILYSNGAVIHESEDSSAMRSRPSWYMDIDSNSVAIRTIVTRGAGSLQGDGSVTISLVKKNSEVNRPPTDQMNITVKSPRNESWMSYFEDLETDNPNIVDDVQMDAEGKVHMDIHNSGLDIVYLHDTIDVRVGR